MTFKLRFIHVNKSGGNSIHLTLNKVYLRYRPKIDYKQYHDNGRCPIDANTLDPETKVFIFIRDPVERFISAYRFMPVQQRLALFRMMEQKLQCKFRKIDKEYDLDQLLVTLAKSKPTFTHIFMKEYHHLGASISKYLTPKSIRELKSFWWFIGKTETINEDFETLKQMMSKEMGVGIDVPLPHLNKTTRVGKLLSPEAVNYLRKWFEKDYECLQEFVELNLLSKEYIHGVLTRMEYIY